VFNLSSPGPIQPSPIQYNPIQSTTTSWSHNISLIIVLPFILLQCFRPVQDYCVYILVFPWTFLAHCCTSDSIIEITNRDECKSWSSLSSHFFSPLQWRFSKSRHPCKTCFEEEEQAPSISPPHGCILNFMFLIYQEMRLCESADTANTPKSADVSLSKWRTNYSNQLRGLFKFYVWATGSYIELSSKQLMRN